MSKRFHPELINDVFADPGVYLDFMFEKRAILFDLGDLGRLSNRKLLRITDVFVSHMHMDHFIGFDHLLRVHLGRDHRIRLFGPEGLIEGVSHKLAAYTWNLVERYDTDLKFIVTELCRDNSIRTATFSCRNAFRSPVRKRQSLVGDRLLEEENLCVRSCVLDHGIPCMAFALEEQVQVNIRKNHIEQMGLGVGAWLKNLKQSILRNEPDDTIIRATWKEDGITVHREVQLGVLRSHVAHVTPGMKIAYVVDAAGTKDNIEKIIALVQGASILFIETPFLHQDIELAEHRRHLTARQAGEIARAARVDRLVTLHFSPRYEVRAEALIQEAQIAFRGVEV